MTNNNKVVAYMKKHVHWEKELAALREIIFSTPLEEKIKWGVAVYTLNGKNVVGLVAFKSHVALWFFQGALLKDRKVKLINAQENKTKALRQWRFSSYEEISKNSATIEQYIEEAIANQKQGKLIKPNRHNLLIIPKELELLFAENALLKEKFNGLTKSKQRVYVEYITEAKKEETRQQRLNKIKPMILQGIGLNDKYKKRKKS